MSVVSKIINLMLQDKIFNSDVTPKQIMAANVFARNLKIEIKNAVSDYLAISFLGNKNSGGSLLPG